MNESHLSFGASCLEAPLAINNIQVQDEVQPNPRTVELLNEGSINISNSRISENKDVEPLSMPLCKPIKEEECKIPLSIKKRYEKKENKTNKLPALIKDKKTVLSRRKNLNLANKSFVKGEEADPYYDKRLKNWTISTTKSTISSETLENMLANEGKNSARKYLLEGILCERKGDFDEAKNNYNKAIELNLTNKDAYLFLGNLFLKLKEYAQAVEIFRKEASNLIRDYPSNFVNDSDSTNPLHIQTDEESLKALCSMSEDGLEMSIHRMSSVCSESTDSRLEDINELVQEIYQSLRHNLCEAYLVWVKHLVDKDKYDEAIEKLKEIIAQSSSYSGDAYLCWGCILILKQKFEEAAEKFSHVFKSNEPEKTVSEKYQLRRQKKYNEQDEFGALKSEGVDLCRDNKFNKAVSVFEKAIILKPENLSANWDLVKALISAGRNDEAVPHLKKVYNIEHNIVAKISRGIVSFYKEGKKMIRAVHFCRS